MAQANGATSGRFRSERLSCGKLWDLSRIALPGTRTIRKSNVGRGVRRPRRGRWTKPDNAGRDPIAVSCTREEFRRALLCGDHSEHQAVRSLAAVRRRSPFAVRFLKAVNAYTPNFKARCTTR